MREPNHFGVYLHLPFCRARCPYCDFVSNEVCHVPAAPYTQALHQEWATRQEAFAGAGCQTLYVGGGTPSLWSAQELAALLAPFLELGASEVTVEVNPADVDAHWFATLVASGVTRFSIGTQSLDPERLALLGRRHDEKQAEIAIAQALHSGAAVSADLIYATPGSSAQAVAAEAMRLASLGVEHVSAYELTLAPGTPMARRVAAGVLHAVDEDEVLAQWFAVEEALSQAGLARYEVSNFALEGRECHHNQLYWRGGIYAGLGAGAHGHLRKGGHWIRYANGPDLTRYLEASARIDDEPLAGGHQEIVSPIDHARELVMLGLRTVEGCDWSAVTACLDPAEVARFDAVAERLVNLGHAQRKNGQLTPSPAGMLLADELASWF